MDVTAETTVGEDPPRVPGFEVVLTHDGRCSTITVHGELDLASSSVLAVTLEGVRANGERRVVVDLGEAFVDVAGLRPLEAAAIGGIAVLLRRPSPLTVKLLTLTGLDRVLAVEAAPAS